MHNRTKNVSPIVINDYTMVIIQHHKYYAWLYIYYLYWEILLKKKKKKNSDISPQWNVILILVEILKVSISI